MTDFCQLGLPRWHRVAAEPRNRCLIPLTEFCGWTPEAHPVGFGKPVKGEMWFACTDQPVFAVAGFWQCIGAIPAFAMMTCDLNTLVAPIHHKAITMLKEANWDRWLRGNYDDIAVLQQPYPAERMTVRGPVFPTRIPSEAMLPLT